MECVASFVCILELSCIPSHLQLCEVLRVYSTMLEQKTKEVHDAVDDLVFEARTTSTRMNNVLNSFMLLSNTQFMENVRAC
jgi:hypothetical protein